MSEDLRSQIFNNMKLKGTDELLEIWQDNDHVEWSDEAFEAIAKILKNRGIEIPQQSEPVYEYSKEEENKDYGFSDTELKIVDDENPPDFYEPLEVLKLEKLLELGAKVAIGVSVVAGLVEFPRALNTASNYVREIPGWWFLALLVALLMMSVGIGLQILINVNNV